jgi:tetratricopeptide (TPR) repeat protein
LWEIGLMNKLVLFAALGTLILSACERRPPAETPAPPADAPRADDALARAETELALTPPDGERPTDVAVRRQIEAATKLPDKPDVWVKLGQAWLARARVSREGLDWQRADIAADVALKKVPDLPAALNVRALVLLHGHRFAAARDAAERILQIDASDPMALGTLSDAQLELGDLKAARAAAQRMIDIKPNLPSYTRAAWLRWLLGDVAGALDLWRLAIDAGRGALPEPTAFALTEAARLFWHRGDLGGADKGLDMALAVQPGYGPALLLKARVALAQGDAARAATLAKQAQVFEPLVEGAWLLEDALRTAGDEAGANAAAADVARIGADDGRAFANYRAVRKQDLDGALADMQRERRVRGGPYTLDTHAWVLHRSGRAADARVIVDELRKKLPPDARLLYHVGAVLMATGEEEEGRALVNKALKTNPHFDVVEAAEARALVGS